MVLRFDDETHVRGFKLDNFTQKRIAKFIDNFKIKSGTSPTLKDFESAGISKDLVEESVKRKFLEQFYVTLTNGTVVKTYKVRI